jgi:hypothetical protein
MLAYLHKYIRRRKKCQGGIVTAGTVERLKWRDSDEKNRRGRVAGKVPASTRGWRDAGANPWRRIRWAVGEATAPAGRIVL